MISFFVGLQLSWFSSSQISNVEIPIFPDFRTPAADKLSDPNLTPLPMHPGIKYVARSPCCDITRAESQECIDHSQQPALFCRPSCRRLEVKQRSNSDKNVLDFEKCTKDRSSLNMNHVAWTGLISRLEEDIWLRTFQTPPDQKEWVQNISDYKSAQ